MFKRFLTKGVLLAAISFVVMGVFVLNTIGKTSVLAKPDFSRATDTLRTQSAAKDGGRVEDIAQTLLGYGFAGKDGVNLAHDKVFMAKAAAAFNEGRAIRIFSGDLYTAGTEFIKKSGEVDISANEVGKQLVSAENFLANQVFTEAFLQKIVNEINKIDKNKAEAAIVNLNAEIGQMKEGDDKKKALANLETMKKALAFLETIKVIAANEDIAARNAQAYKALVTDTRFILFLFGEKGLDNSLFSVGNILSLEHRELISHIGTYPYAGSENIQGGARTVYLTLARINGLQELGKPGLEATQEIMLHTFLDMASGRHVEPSAKTKAMLTKINEGLDKKFREETRGFATEVTEAGPVVVSNDKVKIEKFRLVDDLGRKDTFALQGLSKVHPLILKGSGQKVTVTIAKADVGSIGGHGTAPGKMLEAVAEVWTRAAEQGLILSFFITRVGDDISVTVTHAQGKDNKQIHETIWNGFVNGAVIAKDLGYYGAGQDLLANAFSGNVRGAGPSVAEMVFEESPAEVLIIGQADKTAPGAFNKGLWDVLFSPNTTWRPLGGGEARSIKVGMLDFDYDDSKGRHIWWETKDYADAAWYMGFPDRYTIDNVQLGNGEDFAAVTAQRLGKIAGKYVGKDDPMFMVRSQKRFPAVGEIVSPFVKGTYVVPGWMRGSNKGPFLPVALKDARIGIYDGPPLLGMWCFNLNNGILEGFYDLMGANPAIRYIQDRRAAKAVEMLENGFDEMNLRVGPEEIEYQDGPRKTEAALAGKWEIFKEEKDGGRSQDVVDQKDADKKWQDVAAQVIALKTKGTSTAFFTNIWGNDLANFAIASPRDIHHRVSDEAMAVNDKKDGKVYTILLNHEAFLKKSPDGVMALQSLAGQLGKGNIKFVLHINRDDVKPADVDKITAEVLAKINAINGDYTQLTREVFSAVVVGTNVDAVAEQVNDKLKADIFEVIGPMEYVSKFEGEKFKQVAKIALAKADVEKGESESLSMAKALKLGVELVPSEGIIKNEQLAVLDNLFSQDASGTFQVRAMEAVAEVETKAIAYQKAVEAAEIGI